MSSSPHKKLLQQRNLKATITRLNLLNKMEEHGSAISYSAIQKQMNQTDRVTLYRTIEVLKEKGIIHKAFQDNKDTYYAICGNTCGEGKHHHEHFHFKCLSCSTIICKDLTKPLERSIDNYEVFKISINIEGICESCR